MKFESLDLDDAFEDFMRRVYPRVKPYEGQFRESRRVWFACAAAIYYQLLAITVLDEDDALKELKRIEGQIDEFRDRVETGRD